MATTAAAPARLRAIDWLRGLVMALMTVDHAGNIVDKQHMHGDQAVTWAHGESLPAGEFLTRWVTHLCAPTFVLLAGASLALSVERRAARPGAASPTGFIVRRGLFIAALDLVWMSWGFTRSGHFQPFILQVLYAIGLSLVAMAFLRRLPTAALLGLAVAIQLGGEWLGSQLPQPFFPGGAFDSTVWQTPVRYVAGAALLNGGPLTQHIRTMVIYPLLPWLSIMMAGWALGRWLVRTTDRRERARKLALGGVALLAVFAVVRGLDGYGNWNLHRDSLDFLQWLHVAKYPPSISFTTLELGLALLLLAGFTVLDDDRPHPLLAPLGVLGATAFFYYLFHVHLLLALDHFLHVDHVTHGLAKTWLFAAAALILLYPLCVQYRRYKAAHPDGWTRYI